MKKEIQGGAAGAAGGAADEDEKPKAKKAKKSAPSAPSAAAAAGDGPVIEKAIKKGSAVLDKVFVKKHAGLVKDVQVYEVGKDIYDVMLNQTNIGKP